MNFKEIQELIKLIAKTELSEFKLKDGEFQLHVRGKDYAGTKESAPSIINMTTPAATPAYAPPAAPAAAPAAPAAAAPAPATPAPAAAAAPESTANYVEVKSPMIGTFYRSSSPDKDAYVKVGDTIKVGDTVCIIEAMKLFNEIESEVAGKIVKVMVEDAQPVEYDQVLFLVDPAG
ncbi:MAG: acetyl-CoA carboxylase biotin carboxyl carrier protein [Bacteroidota bacterium]